MSKVKLTNDLCYKLSPELIKAIYRKAYLLDATEVVVNKAKWDWADLNLYDGNDCIAEHLYAQA